MTKARSQLLVTGLLAEVFFTKNLDGTIIASALPQMARSLRASAVHLNAGITAYLMTIHPLKPSSVAIAGPTPSKSDPHKALDEWFSVERGARPMLIFRK